MAAEDASQPTKRPAAETIFLDGFDHIAAAGGLETTAGAEQRRNAALVNADGEDQTTTWQLPETNHPP